MKHFRIFGLLACLLALGSLGYTEVLRPPAVPLITHDPYFSVWSMDDQLTTSWSKHWTGSTHAMAGYARIDGKSWRMMGIDPDTIPAMEQVGLQVTPTRSIYRLQGGGVEIELEFCSPLLVKDLAVMARPVSYITWTVKSTDGQPHEVAVYLDVTGEWVVNTSNQEIQWTRAKIAGIDALRMGTVEQPVLAKAGDNLRIDWGYLYLAVPGGQDARTVIASDRDARTPFVESGVLADSDDLRMPRRASDQWPVMACVLPFGKVGADPVAKHVMLAYDDQFSIEYLDRKLRPYWRQQFADVSQLLSAAAREYESLRQRCGVFDEELTRDMEAVAGEEFAWIGAMAYRQCLAAHKLAMDFDGTPLHFSKECFSNGCIATVDVTYPASPFFLLFNTELLKGQLIPILEYAQSKRWKFNFAPHDLGTYPLANGQRYGGGEESEENQMMVEESGNMLIMAAGIAKVEKNAEFARKYWPVLTEWAEYLREQGLDPKNQLCTDDFAGHLAHNCNLSIKAIMALGGYAQMAAALGYAEVAQTYRQEAEAMAAKWVEMAADGDHYRLAFDRPGTWSQKYNLVWDTLLELNLFPKDVARKEISYYKKVMNPYGLPLDNRETYTKADWELWIAALAGSKDDMQFFIHPVFRFLQDTPDRVPFTDWYWTKDARHRGFQHRSVIGGVFIPMLTDPALWEKWAK
ncbi:MAG: DUF4965 domain-containing protein [bacterium]|nr:DUF4965 domain-containing protein [bacterium]